MNCKRIYPNHHPRRPPPTATNATESATNIAAVSTTFHATTLHPKLAHSPLSQSADAVDHYRRVHARDGVLGRAEE